MFSSTLEPSATNLKNLKWQTLEKNMLVLNTYLPINTKLNTLLMLR